MGKRDWRLQAVRVEVEAELQPNEWYRSPLWEKDHLLGLRNDLLGDGLAWCGRALAVVQDWDRGEEYGGLWYTNRRAAQCAQCRTRQKEYDAAATDILSKSS